MLLFVYPTISLALKDILAPSENLKRFLNKNRLKFDENI